MLAMSGSPFNSRQRAHFTVVGEFASAERAEAATLWLRQFVRATGEARRTRPTWGVNRARRTAPEWAAARWLRLAWPAQTPDWMWRDGAATARVTRLDRYVFVDGNASRAGAYPVDALIERLGGVAHVEGCRRLSADGAVSQRSQLMIRVSCRAPAEAGHLARPLEVRGDQFFHLADGLAGTLAYLRAEGCTEIAVSFSETRLGAPEA